MAARAYSGKKPKNLKHTLRVFLSYLGRHKKMLAVVAVLVTISAGANLFGTYMIRPVVNGLADGDVHTLLRGVLITALIFGCGALAAYGYTQTMVKAAQQVVFDIRRDLFRHIQELGFDFYDRNRTGQLMSRLTADLFDITELAHHGPEDIFISGVTIVGALAIMFTIQWQLALVIACIIPVFFLVVWSAASPCRTPRSR